MHLALQNTETIDCLVAQGALLLRTFYVEHEKAPAGWNTQLVRGELIGWRSTLHTLYRDYAEDIVTRVVARTHLPIPDGKVAARGAAHGF